jgi:hypothetical protein
MRCGGQLVVLSVNKRPKIDGWSIRLRTTSGLQSSVPRWAAFGQLASIKLRKPRFFWRPMTPVSSQVSNGIDGGQRASLIERRFRRSATFVKISRESASSDTARLAAICYSGLDAGLQANPLIEHVLCSIVPWGRSTKRSIAVIDAVACPQVYGIPALFHWKNETWSPGKTDRTSVFPRHRSHGFSFRFRCPPVAFCHYLRLCNGISQQMTYDSARAKDPAIRRQTRNRAAARHRGHRHSARVPPAPPPPGQT